MRGRTPPGPEFVHRLEGDAYEKQRLEMILQTLNGDLGVKEASDRLGITPQRFHMLREEAFQAALQALAARPLGRPRQTPTLEQEQIDALKQANEQLQRALEASRLREEIAMVLPQRPRRREKKSRRPSSPDQDAAS